MAHKVSIWTRQPVTQKYIKARPRTVYAEGTRFVLRFHRTWETTNATSYKEAARLAATKHAELILAPPEQRKPYDARPKLATAIEKYLIDIETRKSPNTAKAYSISLKQFQSVCTKTYLSEITVDDLKDFVGHLKHESLNDCTIANRVRNVTTFLRSGGITNINLECKANEKIVRTYSEAELEALFAATTPEEHLIFSFFLQSGAREGEVSHAYKDDIGWHDGVYTVRARNGWVSKGRRDREVPIPDSLLIALREHVKKSPNSDLLLPGPDGKPQRFLHMLKKLAVRAGLDPKDCILHRFRKTFATLHHRRGVTVRTLQTWLGHASLETTMLYLAYEDARSEDVRRVVNDTFSSVVAVAPVAATAANRVTQSHTKNWAGS